MRTDAHQLFEMLKPYIASMLRDSVGGVQGVGVGGGGVGGGGTGLGLHALNGQHHTGTLSNDQAPQFLLRDGTRSLTGNLSVSPSVTIDGVQLANFWSLYQAHIANKDAHHRAFIGLVVGGTDVNSHLTTDRITMSATGSLQGVAGTNAVTLSLRTPGTLTGATTNNSSVEAHTHNIDAYFAPGTVANRILMTSSSGFVNINQLQATDWFQLNTDVRIQRTSPNVVDFIGNVGQGVRVRFNEQVQIGTPFIPTSYQDGLLLNMSTLEGGIRLRRTEPGGGNSYITANSDGSLRLITDGSIYLDPAGKFVYPVRKYEVNIGSFQQKYLSIHAAELWVETLVAHETMATIGGRILVGKTSTLEEDVNAFPSMPDSGFYDARVLTAASVPNFVFAGFATNGVGDLVVAFVSLRKTVAQEKFMRIQGWRMLAENKTHFRHHVAVFYCYARTQVVNFTVEVHDNSFFTSPNADLVRMSIHARSRSNSSIWSVKIHEEVSSAPFGDLNVTVNYNKAESTTDIFGSICKNSGGEGYQTNFQSVADFTQLNQLDNATGALTTGLWERNAWIYNDGIFAGRTIAPTVPLGTISVVGVHVVYVNQDAFFLKHNAFIPGDMLYMEGNGKVEFFEVQTVSQGWDAPFAYSLRRDLDGTGPNDWYAGDAIFTTGNKNVSDTGFLDLYSVHGTKGQQVVGPAISVNIRDGQLYNDWYTRVHIGNLNGVYGYGSNVFGFAAGKPNQTWIGIDEQFGIRIMSNQTVNAQWDVNGNLTIGRTSTNLGNVYVGASGVLHLRQGTTPRITLNADGTSSFMGAMFFGPNAGFWQGSGTFDEPTSGVKLWNDNGQSKIGAWNNQQKNVEINSDGITFTTPDNWQAYSGAFFVNKTGTLIGRISGTNGGLEIRAFSTRMIIQGNSTGFFSGIEFWPTTISIIANGARLYGRGSSVLGLITDDDITFPVVGAYWGGPGYTNPKAHIEAPVNFGHSWSEGLMTTKYFLCSSDASSEVLYMSGAYGEPPWQPNTATHIAVIRPQASLTALSMNMFCGSHSLASGIVSNASYVDRNIRPGNAFSFKFTAGNPGSTPVHSQLIVFEGSTNQMRFFNSVSPNPHYNYNEEVLYKLCMAINNDGTVFFNYDIDAQSSGVLTLQNGFTQTYGSIPIRWSRSGARMVFVEGVVSFSGQGSGTTIATLPTQCRPLRHKGFACAAQGNNQIVKIAVNIAGEIVSMDTFTGWVYLTGISFPLY